MENKGVMCLTENVHFGHRDRMKKEFLAHGFDETTPPHKILELLLFFCIKQADTNPLAHQLINKYKTIAGVLDAPVDELIQFNGITESNVVLLKMIVPLSRAYRLEKLQSIDRFDSIEEIGSYFLEQYVGFTEETLSILSLDGNGRKQSFDIVSKGDLSSVGVSTRDIIQLVLKTRASCVVMAHNHPGGVALPSAADVSITEMVYAALSHIGVRLLDHIIIANDDYITMHQSKKYASIFTKQ